MRRPDAALARDAFCLMAEEIKKEKKKKKPTPTAPEPASTPAANGTVVPPPKRVLIPIASPLADDKLCRKVLKLAKKASKRKQIKRGVKEVVKAIRKKFKGYEPAQLCGMITPSPRSHIQ